MFTYIIVTRSARPLVVQNSSEGHNILFTTSIVEFWEHRPVVGLKYKCMR